MRERKLAIFFPGGKYGTQAPLFYYADLVMAEKGYEVIEISYDDLAVTSSDWINQTREQIWGRLKRIDFSAYGEISFPYDRILVTCVIFETDNLLFRRPRIPVSDISHPDS